MEKDTFYDGIKFDSLVKSRPGGAPRAAARADFWRRGSMEVLEGCPEKFPPAFPGGIFPGELQGPPSVAVPGATARRDTGIHDRPAYENGLPEPGPAEAGARASRRRWENNPAPHEGDRSKETRHPHEKKGKTSAAKNRPDVRPLLAADLRKRFGCGYCSTSDTRYTVTS